MPAPAFAAIATLEVIFFSKDNIPFGTVIKIFWVEVLIKHVQI